MNVVYLDRYRRRAGATPVTSLEIALTFARGAGVRMDLARSGALDLAGAEIALEFAWRALQHARDTTVGDVAGEAIVTRIGQALLSLDDELTALQALWRPSGVRAKRLR